MPPAGSPRPPDGATPRASRDTPCRPVRNGRKEHARDWTPRGEDRPDHRFGLRDRAIDDPKYLEEQVQSIPCKRAAEPGEIAKLAVFLASDDADYVTGSTNFMDGGLMQNQG
ncbi:hypothetical protein GCM10023176_17070 [Micromonospora coerulea]|uniref:SDR family oxidoreductase n=1 Tax=Micromonospora coerulea TaxID=47856 RepID=A0ABP8SFG0_9ACTN